MIELRDVSFAYEERAVLSGVDLFVDEGELLVVSGRTGVGKSTLLGIITGLVPRFTGGMLSGDVRVAGSSVLHVPPRERAHLVGYVGQNPAAGFVTDTVEQELAYGMEQLGLPAGTMRRRVEETLDLLGIADLRDRDLRTLSGGQQQRVAIGSVLTMHPRALVLDEPTSALDPTAAEDVLATVTRLVHDLGLSVILAEHRLERVVPFADEMALVDGTVTVGSPTKILAASPVVPPIVELGRIAGWSPLPLSVREARRRARGLSLPPPAVPAVPSGPALLGTSGLTVARGSATVLAGVDLTLAAGAVTALMGRNGSGKSTLLWALQGSLARHSGSVWAAPSGSGARSDPARSDPARLEPAARRRLIGLVPQTAADLLYLETVAEECAAAERAEGVVPGTCRGLLDRFAPGIDDAVHPRDLSEGQRLALALAIVLASSPPVVLLDEPTRGLDYPAKAQLAAVLRELARDGRTVLVATHDVEFVAAAADEVVVLAQGEVVSRGSVVEVVTESPSYAPQTAKMLGPGWLRPDQVRAALGEASP